MVWGKSDVLFLKIMDIQQHYLRDILFSPLTCLLLSINNDLLIYLFLVHLIDLYVWEFFFANNKMSSWFL